MSVDGPRTGARGSRPAGDPGTAPTGAAEAVVYRFSGCELSARSLELRRHGAPVPLQLQPARLLALLCSRPGVVVERDLIRHHLWGPETHVDAEQGINYSVRHIRLALGDDAREPRFVETLPGRGYRFLPQVERGPADAPMAVPGEDAEPVAGRGRRWWPLTIPLAAAGLAAVVLVGLPVTRGTRQTPESLQQAAATESTANRSPGFSLPAEPLAGVPGPAREAYLRGAYLAERADREREAAAELLVRAETALRRALALHPELAAAHAELAEVSLARRRYVLPDASAPHRASPDELLAASLAAARRAVEIAPDLPAGHLALSRGAFQAWDWELAERAARRAVAIDPADAETHLALAAVLSALGLHDDAVAAARRARGLDPGSFLVAADLAYFELNARRFDATTTAAREAIELAPEAAFQRMVEIEALRAQGDEAGAVAALNRWQEAAGDPAVTSLDPLWSEWDALLDELEGRVRVSGVERALIALGQGRTEAALAWLERAVAERYGGGLAFLAVDPRYDPLRGDPRFARLLEELDLPPEAPGAAPPPFSTLASNSGPG